MRTLLLAGVVAAAMIGPAQASLIGDTVHYNDDFPDMNTIIRDNGDATVSNAVEYDVDGFTIDFQSQKITIQNHSFLYLTFSDAAFNGLDLSDLSFPFTSVSIDSSSTQLAFTPSDLSLLDGVIYVNFSGLTFDLAQTVVLDVTTTKDAVAVPEPASLALLALPLGAAGVLAMRRRGAGVA